MTDLIRGTSLSQAADLLAEYGADAASFFARAGLDPGAAEDYDRFVPFTALSAFLGLCALELDVPDFALRLAARQDADILGPVAIAARYAATIGEALQCVADHAHVYSPAITNRVQSGRDLVSFEFDTVLKHVPHRAHVVELALAVALRSFRRHHDSRFRPARITFTHPAIANPSIYRAHLGCPVLFEQPQDALVLHARVARQRVLQADPLAHRTAVALMQGHQRGPRFEDVVGSHVLRLLPTGPVTLGAVAGRLARHPRAVQRALAAEGTTYEQVVDDVRRRATITLLANRELPLAAVSRQVGYSEQSTLTRSCRRWFGVPPSAQRRALTQAAPSVDPRHEPVRGAPGA